jgi:hypothetical protein
MGLTEQCVPCRANGAAGQSSGTIRFDTPGGYAEPPGGHAHGRLFALKAPRGDAAGLPARRSWDRSHSDFTAPFWAEPFWAALFWAALFWAKPFWAEPFEIERLDARDG